MGHASHGPPRLVSPPRPARRAFSTSPREPPLDDTLVLRSVRFSADHRYHRAEWSEERNREVFGQNADVHAHDWRVEVTVRGSVDPRTGWAVDLAALDRLLDREVVRRFDGRAVHEEIETMSEGRVQPSTEEIARWIFRRLETRMPGAARLVRVRVEEGPDLAAIHPAG